MFIRACGIGVSVDVHGLCGSVVCWHNDGLIADNVGEYMSSSKNLAKENKLY